uniref:Uncharacterized protein n=1 Tax=Anas platyrhynchos platyrhynchos TaxID=8840 RepID=A0A493TNR2_ANAPP
FWICDFPPSISTSLSKLCLRTWFLHNFMDGSTKTPTTTVANIPNVTHSLSLPAPSTPPKAQVTNTQPQPEG